MNTTERHFDFDFPTQLEEFRLRSVTRATTGTLYATYENDDDAEAEYRIANHSPEGHPYEDVIVAGPGGETFLDEHLSLIAAMLYVS